MLQAHPELRWIYPVGDLQILFFAEHAASLSARLRYAMVRPELVRACLDKPEMYAQAAACGLPLAETRTAYSMLEVRAAADELRYPLIVKPATSQYRIDDAKAIILRSDADLEYRLGRWPATFQALLVQRYYDGSRHNCGFLAHGGEVLAYFEHRVLRTNRSDGTGYIVDAVTVPPSEVLREYVVRLVRRVGYEGVGVAQFLVDETDGVAQCFLEVNGRLDATCAIPYHAGYDFPAMNLDYCRHLAGELAALPGRDTPYATGRRFASTYDDLLGLAWERRHGASTAGTARGLARAVATAALASRHLTWSWRDPRPTLWQYGQLLRSWLHI